VRLQSLAFWTDLLCQGTIFSFTPKSMVPKRKIHRASDTLLGPEMRGAMLYTQEVGSSSLSPPTIAGFA
jgi:hypothetical protein